MARFRGWVVLSMIFMLSLATAGVTQAQQGAANLTTTVSGDCKTLNVAVTNTGTTNLFADVTISQGDGTASIPYPVNFYIRTGTSNSTTIPFAYNSDLGPGTFNAVVTSEGGIPVTSKSGKIDCPEKTQSLNNDGANRFAIFCQANGGISVSMLNNIGNTAQTVVANAGQLAGALVNAARLNENQIAAGGFSGLSVWGLKSGEIQLVYRGIQNFDYVVSASVCGGIDLNSVPVSVLPAFAPTPAGTVTTTIPGSVTGTGIIIPAPTTCAPIAPNTRAHVVQRGQNLYRIGIAYGVGLNVIVNANGIYNANVVYVGQCLQIP